MFYLKERGELYMSESQILIKLHRGEISILEYHTLISMAAVSKKSTPSFYPYKDSNSTIKPNTKGYSPKITRR